MLTEPGASRWAYRALHDLKTRRHRRERQLGRRERVGDASPYDLFHPRAPETARRLIPDARFIVILRDPVYRAWSHHRHAMRHGLESLDFATAIDAEPERLAGEEGRLRADPNARSGPHQHWSYLSRGRYAEQLERWFATFPRERFLILFTDDLRDRPDELLRRLENHLDLPPTPHPPSSDPANAGDGSSPPPETVERLRSAFDADDRRLMDLLGTTPPWLKS